MKGTRLTLIRWTFALLAPIVALAGCSAGGGDDYDDNPQTYSVSGRVELNGAGISGVAVSLSGAGSASVTTDSNGDYRFSGLSN